MEPASTSILAVEEACLVRRVSSPFSYEAMILESAYLGSEKTELILAARS